MTKTCQICYKKVARIDGRTKVGPWAYMCKSCHAIFGVGFGIGKGQILVIKKIKTPKLTKEQKDKICTYYLQNRLNIQQLASVFKTSTNHIRMLVRSKHMSKVVNEAGKCK